MLDRDIALLEDEPLALLLDGVLNALYLLSDDREYFKVDTVELIEATLGSRGSETLENTCHTLVAHLIGAISIYLQWSVR